MPSPRPTRHVALLRAVNVGGKNKLPMADLAALFEDAGCENVRTYIQSGNVVFSAPAALANSIPARIHKDIQERFGIDTPVITRTANEIDAVLASVPFLGMQVDEAFLHVAFLDRKPTADAARTLDSDRSPPDRFALLGRDLYLHRPNGVARSKLTGAYIDKTLGVTSTARNWRTVKRFAEMVSSQA